MPATKTRVTSTGQLPTQGMLIQDAANKCQHGQKRGTNNLTNKADASAAQIDTPVVNHTGCKLDSPSKVTLGEGQRTCQAPTHMGL